MTPLYAWANRHNVSWQAIEELRAIFGTDKPNHEYAQIADRSEAAVQNNIRLAAPKKGYMLWRNNVGSLLDSRGVPVRFGLGNDSPQINRVLKSSDLVGWKPTLVTPSMVGRYVAVFVALEVKESVWRYKGDAHEKAQESWLKLVAADGGIARFVTKEGDLP
jgi:hypothetical protein